MPELSFRQVASTGSLVTGIGKITVITAVLNAVDSIEETIKSVLDCCYENLEYIIIDGISTDGTLDVIGKYQERLKAWVSEKDHGVYDAMNKGWALADPESWVIFLGAGDRLLSLPVSLDAPREPYSVLYGNVSLEKQLVFYAGVDFRLRLYNTLHHQGLLIPKRLHPEPPFDTIYRLYADFDFNQRLYKRNVKFFFEPALQGYAAPDGLTERLQLQELTQIVRKNFGFFWWGLSLAGFTLVRCLPFLRKYRTIKSV
ncbi:glycosyltransferase family 2 protein [Deltaproteobacteria bacterium IMCC39524]|nr:glycosyltransferase family 2 protein [Deltaproteobacteria bacterium IMCC39524]